MQQTLETTTPYMLIFRDTKPENYEAMSLKEKRELLKQWNDWYEGLLATGKAKVGHPLQTAGRVVTGEGGERVFDGPFAEGKEAVGGFFLLTVTNLEEATEIAKLCPSLRHGLVVEVRQIAPRCAVLSMTEEQQARELASV